MNLDKKGDTMKITDRNNILTILADQKAKLEIEYDVKRMGVFGSIARGEGHENSDLDVLVSFKEKATARKFFNLKFYLEDLLGCKVDLVTEKALKAQLKPIIEKEIIHV